MAMAAKMHASDATTMKRNEEETSRRKRLRATAEAGLETRGPVAAGVAESDAVAGVTPVHGQSCQASSRLEMQRRKALKRWPPRAAPQSATPLQVATLRERCPTSLDGDHGAERGCRVGGWLKERGVPGLWVQVLRGFGDSFPLMESTEACVPK